MTRPVESKAPPRGTKPWFVRKLPSRVEVLEGQTFGLLCHTAGRGCKPWFIRKLPNRLEMDPGHNVAVHCRVKESTEAGQFSSVTTQDARPVPKRTGRLDNAAPAYCDVQPPPPPTHTHLASSTHTFLYFPLQFSYLICFVLCVLFQFSLLLYSVDGDGNAQQFTHFQAKIQFATNHIALVSVSALSLFSNQESQIPKHKVIRLLI